MREEIREGLTWLVEHSKPEEGETMGHTLINYLHSQGVVIKVDRELPVNKRTCNMRVIGEPEITKQVQGEIRREMEIWDDTQQDMLNAGYVAVESLIEEDV